jgi:hypothetical protein
LGRPLKELKKKYLTIILPKNKIRIIDWKVDIPEVDEIQLYEKSSGQDQEET